METKTITAGTLAFQSFHCFAAGINLEKDEQVKLEQTKTRNGELLTESNAVRPRWKKHSEELLNIKSNMPTNNSHVNGAVLLKMFIA